ncbi:MAG TPA: hypothetical protein VNB06_18130, partial [Thermoanaerobaculia bacterium]|nr:hypothetical protein [Thermoanaerobaculia bacterium]
MTPADLGAIAPPTIWTDPNRRSGENWTVRSLQSVAEFRGLRTEWTTLLESSRSNSLFLTWEWLFT